MTTLKLRSIRMFPIIPSLYLSTLISIFGKEHFPFGGAIPYAQKYLLVDMHLKQKYSSSD